MEHSLFSNSSTSFASNTSQGSISTDIINLAVAQDLRCFLVSHEVKEIERSIVQFIIWFVIAIVSLVLNGATFNFFWQEHNSWRTYRVLLLNLLSCNLSVGFLTQALVATLFIKDTCSLRAICTVAIPVTNHFSLISLTFISFSQQQRALKLSRRAVPDPGTKLFDVCLVSITWVYCGFVALIKFLYPSSYVPLVLCAVISLLLVSSLIFIVVMLRRIRRNVIGTENQAQDGTLESLVLQLDDVSKMVLIVLVVALVTWLPAIVVSLLFRFGVIWNSSRVGIFLKISLHILSLAPSLDVLCFLFQTPRLRRSIKEKLKNIFT